MQCLPPADCRANEPIFHGAGLRALHSSLIPSRFQLASRKPRYNALCPGLLVLNSEISFRRFHDITAQRLLPQ